MSGSSSPASFELCASGHLSGGQMHKGQENRSTRDVVQSTDVPAGRRHLVPRADSRAVGSGAIDFANSDSRNPVVLRGEPDSAVSGSALRRGELGGDLDDLVFLTADELAPTAFEKDFGTGHVVARRRAERVLEEARVHARIPDDQREAIE